MFNIDKKWKYKETSSSEIEKMVGEWWRKRGIDEWKNGRIKEAISIFIDNAQYRNNPRSYTYLGYIYQFGIGIERNDKRAVFFYKKGHDRGDRKASTMLSIFYFTTGDIKKSNWYKVDEKPLLMSEEEGFSS